MSSTLTSTPALVIQELVSSPIVQRAFEFFDTSLEDITREHVEVCSIPAPPFGEQQRAEYLAERFRKLGLDNVGIDREGNCVALRSGRDFSPLLVVSAHLDTVFPPGTDFSVRQLDHRLMAPGISDDGCGLAALIALTQALNVTKLTTQGSLLFVGTVGEEGEGNLRGVRHLLTESQWVGRVDGFVSFDGPGADRITNGALGSRRYRVILKGSGGHSWGDFGVTNPVHALGRAIAKLASYPAPRKPRTTFNVGRIEGGSSINAIPSSATMDVDLRSASEDELLRLDAFFRRAVCEAIDEENAERRQGDQSLMLDLQVIGERPSGETSANAPLVELAREATRAVGLMPRLDQASTDSNLPISLGIPAITLGAGGSSGNSHTLDEWYDPRGRDLGLKRALLVTIGFVGLADN